VDVAHGQPREQRLDEHRRLNQGQAAVAVDGGAQQTSGNEHAAHDEQRDGDARARA
jgi:hypothetical protein